MNYNYCCIHKQRTHEKTFVFSHALFYTIVVYTIVEFYKFEWRYIYGKVDKNLL